jgi:hypothetical protein
LAVLMNSCSGCSSKEHADCSGGCGWSELDGTYIGKCHIGNCLATAVIARSEHEFDEATARNFKPE